MPPNLLYVGTYTDQIHTLRLDPATGALEEIAATQGIGNPSYLAFHPRGDILYAVNELLSHEGGFGGAVSAFAIDPATGRLKFINAEATHGADPCHLAVDPTGRAIVVANYTSGHVTLLPIRADGGLAPAAQVIAHAGASVDPVRQTSAHPHHVAFDATGARVYVADLGLDAIVAYRFAPATGALASEGVAARTAPGGGPRRFRVHPTAPSAYVLNELASTITVCARDREGGFSARASVSTRPPGSDGENSGAEMHIAPSGRFLHASNRGDDSLAIFAIDAVTGDLAPLGHVSTRGRVPRHFEIRDDGQVLAVAHQDSCDVVMFRVDTATGGLAPIGAPIAIPRAVCVRFVNRR